MNTPARVSGPCPVTRGVSRWSPGFDCGRRLCPPGERARNSRAEMRANADEPQPQGCGRCGRVARAVRPRAADQAGSDRCVRRESPFAVRTPILVRCRPMAQTAIFLATDAPAAPVRMMPVPAAALDDLADRERQRGSFTGEIAFAAHRIAGIAAVSPRRLDRDGAIGTRLLAGRRCGRTDTTVSVLGPGDSEEQRYRYYY